LEDVIGHGTWYDKIAVDIVNREKKLGRSLDLVRVESGVAASGIPHIGSLGEVTRNYAVSLALGEQGYNSELIVFSDNKDGLRSVPAGLPKSLQKFVGVPVNEVPDPFKCHNSYGDHMVSLLLDALDTCGVKYTSIAGAEAYAKGMLKDEIRLLLESAKRIGEIVKEETGQEKYLEALPYFPTCTSCGRIYTTRAYEFLPKEEKILYVCEGMEIKRKWLEGCGYKGEADYARGEGKLSWKAGEFAARWRALGVRFEAYGKDIADSVAVNDRISREILGYEPPMHVQYEMFLDKGGKKISKSKGNVLAPQVWFKYASPRSMVLLTLKRFVGTRNISMVDIPRYMDELDDLENVYFDRKRIEDARERTKLTGLYKYCWFMRPPETPSVHVPYNLLIGLAKVAPRGSEGSFIMAKLRYYGYVKDSISADLVTRTGYALNWAEDFKEAIGTQVELSSEERSAVEQLIQALGSLGEAEAIQSSIFDIARRTGVKPKRFFEVLYLLLLGTPYGPRLGPYIADLGRENTLQSLSRNLKTSATFKT